MGPGTFPNSIGQKRCDVLSVILLRKTVTFVLQVDLLFCCHGLHAQMKETCQSVPCDGELRAASANCQQGTKALRPTACEKLNLVKSLVSLVVGSFLGELSGETSAPRYLVVTLWETPKQRAQ